MKGAQPNDRTLIIKYRILKATCSAWSREATAEEVAVDVKKRCIKAIQTRSLVGEGAIKKNEPTCYIIGMLNIISKSTKGQKRRELEKMRFYNSKIHEVVKMSLDNLRASRFWGAQAEEAQEVNDKNYYGIDYARSKSAELKSIAFALYKISKQMRNANGQRKIRLFNRAEELDWEACQIDNR